MSAVRFAPDGTLWVQRTTPAGDPALFDIFDRSGSRVTKLELPAGRELAGFGARHVYLSIRDSNDLQYLERYDVTDWRTLR